MPGQQATSLQEKLNELSTSEEKQKELSQRLDAARVRAQEATTVLSKLRQIDDDLMARPITL